MDVNTFVCCICGKQFDGFGNAPWPINMDDNARCCDTCNRDVIIPVRLFNMMGRRKDNRHFEECYREDIDGAESR